VVLPVSVGKVLLISGVFLILLGLILNYAPWLINWFGKLPGDIRIEDDKKLVFVPIVSMLIVSIILTLVLNFFFHR
jgi:Protein of unknown function (DUF2905)